MNKIDLHETERFLNALDPTASTWTFQIIHEAAKRSSRRAQHRQGSLEELADWLAKMNARGDGVFVTVNETDGSGERKADNIRRVRAVFADFDQPASDILARLRADPMPPSLIVSSSAGKFHAYWLVDDVALEEFTALQLAIAQYWGSDPAVHDLSRVMRLPGFLHRKGEPQHVRLIEVNHQRYGRELAERYQSVVLAKKEPQRGPKTGPTLNNAAFDRLLSRLELVSQTRDGFMACCPAHPDQNPSLSIKQDDSGRILVHCFAGCETRDVLAAVEMDMGDLRPPDRDDELVRLLDDLEPVEDSNTPPERSGKSFRFVRASDMPMKPIAWLVHGYLEEDTLAVLYGPPATGKSFFALDVSCCIASALPFHGHKVKGGAVFYIAGEGHNGIARRLRAWAQHHQGDIPARLFVSEAPTDLADTSNACRVAAAVQELVDETGEMPVLIVIDTMARNFGGDENSATDVGHFVRNADHLRRTWKASVLIVHHCGKNGEKGARGSSALKGAVDAEYEISRKNEDKLVRLTPHKMKDAEEPPTLTFELLEIPLLDDNDEVTFSAVLQLTDSSVPEQPQALKEPKTPKLSEQQRAVLNILKQLQQGQPAPIPIKEWSKRSTEADIDRRRFFDVKNALGELNLIRIEGDYVMLIDPSVRSSLNKPDRTDRVTAKPDGGSGESGASKLSVSDDSDLHELI